MTLTARRPIAVLIGPQTGSSGEAVAISLIGNERTRTFGEPTWGLTTGNGAFDLSDGARIMLASTIMTDRHGRLYRSRIEPDELIEAGELDKDDPVLARAVGWLHGDESGCVGCEGRRADIRRLPKTVRCRFCWPLRGNPG